MCAAAKAGERAALLVCGRPVGVLSYATMLIVSKATKFLPLTLDTDAWYFGQSLIVLVLISALSTSGFLLALAGRPAFGVTGAK